MISPEYEPQKPKILYVEDANLMQTIIRDNLGKDFNVSSAKNGIEALEKLAQEEFDAIVLDIGMPVLNGYYFLGLVKGTYPTLRENDINLIESMEGQAVKKALNGDYEHIPVIVMSTQGLKEEERIKKLGADDIICKPYSSKKYVLIWAIKKALGETNQEKPENN